MYNGSRWNIIADSGDTINVSKYSTSKNPSTGLYYRLHIKNVGVSDVKNFTCGGAVNGIILDFYLKVDLLGRCYHILVIFKVVKQKFSGNKNYYT